MGSKVLDRNIEWIVAFSVGLLGAFDLFQQVAGILWFQSPLFFNSIRFFSFSLLLLYQKKNYGLHILYKPFFLFFFFFSLYIYCDLTLFKQTHSDEFTVNTFVIKTLLIGVLIFCSETIIYHFNCVKFLLLTIFFSLLPSYLYIQFFGAEVLQFKLMRDDNPDNIGVLMLGYETAKIFVISILGMGKYFKAQWMILLFLILIALFSGYLVILSGERGPVLWGIVNLMICVFYNTKRKILLLCSFIVALFLIYINIDLIIEQLFEISPQAAQKVYATIYEGDTSNRYISGASSVYGDSFKQIISAPLFGSYFRLLKEFSSLYDGGWPHNVFLEMLMTMGLLGFLPFCLFLINVFVRLKDICLRINTIYILPLLGLFLSEFLFLMTSGSIVLNSEFWLFFYILCVITFRKDKVFSYKRS